MLNYGMPYGFQEALDRKYALMAQDTAARANAANADANLTNTRAGLLPAESKANVGLTVAQTGLAGAQARGVDENTKFVKPLAEASIFNTRAQGTLFGQQAAGEYQLNRLSPTLANKSPGMQVGSGGMPSRFDEFDRQLQSILKEGLGYH
jgi:hypothetical protein